MVTLLALVIAGSSQVHMELAEGHSAYMAAKPGEHPEINLEEIGEPFKVHRQGNDVRVDLGKSIVLIYLGGKEYIIADMERKVGVRHAPTNAKDADTVLEFARYTVDQIFPLWPSKYMSSLSKTDREEFLKMEAQARGAVREDPFFGEVVDVSKGATFLTRRADPDAVPCVVRWHRMDDSGLYVLTYSGPFEKAAKGPAFAAPDSVRLEDFSSMDKSSWTVFKDEDDYTKWRTSLTAGRRKPKK